MSNNINTLINSNKQAILESSECACIFCLKRYEPKLVSKYSNTNTATCYYCDMESVVPNKLLNYTDKMLLEMRNVKFDHITFYQIN